MRTEIYRKFIFRKCNYFLHYLSLFSFLFLIEGCSSSRYVLTKDEEERVSGFADRLSSSAEAVDTLQRGMLRDGLKAIGEYLLQKDETSFRKLEQEVSSIEGAALQASKIYDIDFLKMATDFYGWANERAASKLATQLGNKMQFVSYTTPHFLIYYFPGLPEKDLHYIAVEAERVYDTLLTLFKPDSLCMSNFQRLAMYESWKQGKFDQETDSLQLTNGKIVLLITDTQEQLLSVAGRSYKEIGGITSVKFVPSSPDSVPVWMTCQIALNYSSPLSLVPLTHEITHAVTMIAYSRPWLIDSVLAKSDVKSISSLSISQVRSAIFRIEGLVAEGAGYWSNWSIGTFADVHFLPTVRGIIQNSKIDLPSLEYLIKGEIDLSFWDMVRAIFGYVPRDKITQFFISSASFMEFLLSRSTPQQLQMLFTGSSEDLKPADIELIYEKPISQLETEWRTYVLQTQQLGIQ